VGGNAWMDEFDGLVAMRNGNGVHLMPDSTGGANIAFYSSNFSDNAVGLNIAPIPNIAGSESAVYVYDLRLGTYSWAIRTADTTSTPGSTRAVILLFRLSDRTADELAQQ